MNKRWIEPATLAGSHVVLDPMSLEHLEGIKQAVRDGELWKLWFTGVPHPDAAEVYIRAALDNRECAGAMPFVIREAKTGKLIGSTRYCNVDESNQRLEIGYTWYSASYQRTAANSECKYLLLNHAFETLGAIAVEFRTHWHNRESRAAIARLGAKQDGVLRNHTRTADGIYRDTVVFSIIDQEWPAVRQSLIFRLGRQT
ncbi:MAG: GNAT family N-acetyltransferase [Gammaproteobacteria bacterium]|nr:GNAT family N-acetyltransferase [Gammaproteobacteria bacterium]